MACRCAPSLLSAQREANRRWPHRSTVSDGCCPSAAHHAQNPGSDHEPHVIIRGVGYATAFDLTHDPDHGVNVDQIFAQMIERKERRIKYLIRNRRIWYPAEGRRPAGWSVYHGTNPHIKHGHMSILPTAVFDDRPWYGGEGTTMPIEQQQILDAVHEVFAHVKAIESVLFVPPDAQGKKRSDPGTLIAELDRRGRAQGLDLGWLKEGVEKIADNLGLSLPPQPGK